MAPSSQEWSRSDEEDDSISGRNFTLVGPGVLVHDRSSATGIPRPAGSVATKAAEKIDEVGRAIKRGLLNAEETVRGGLNKTGETVREGFAKTRETVQGMGIPSRVYGRLHWDKEFHATSLFVKAEGGTVTVRGTLPDLEAKAKAIDLIKDTVGVTRVIDQLTVLSSNDSTSRPSASKSSEKPDPLQ